MLSILIPIYNFDITQLVVELKKQINNLDNTVEIIAFDDHSSHYIEKNKKTAQKYNLNYDYLERNLGRSGIINLLAKHANYEYLLILDCDVLPKTDQFLSTYLSAVSQETEAIYGGRRHEYIKEKTNKLRWKYGFYKEDKTVIERLRKPYLSTLTNNLLIKKELFQCIRFNEILTKYGYEDTLFAYELKKRRSHVEHIDNPVIHKDIDENSIFVDKTERALINLKTIYNSKLIPAKEIQLLKVYEKIKSLKLEVVISQLFIFFENKIRNGLTSDRNNLTLFNIYKLGYFCKINRR
ncbi:glycosyltransferase family 2 protein [Psychroflexus lacisalsi]|jgi:hypothetical protein|uniref:Glycosyltransferase n=1 Tax=Psychroflexus lacisalsi TaxID=503928 RepID=A0ABP3VG19_9FLAO|nr:glycosyltransferase [Psychroflexus lacisalsi]MBZ9619634.1 glycosyltransferase [Psychroflexus lacisalsi]